MMSTVLALVLENDKLRDENAQLRAGHSAEPSVLQVDVKVLGELLTERAQLREQLAQLRERSEQQACELITAQQSSRHFAERAAELRASRDELGEKLRAAHRQEASLTEDLRNAQRARDLAMGEARRLSRLLNPPPAGASND